VEKVKNLNHHNAAVQYCLYCGSKMEPQKIYNETHLTCPNCKWVYYEDPKVAAAVIVVDQDRILLTRRIFNPHKGAWSLPAGFINAREDPQAAAKRECLEETGLEVEIIELVDLISGREHERGADFVIVYSAKICGGELKAGDDADEAVFFSLDHLPELAFQATRQAIQKLRQERDKEE
jgi:ADP-ribose pyrophosphatase YjhB (NUDIX family)